MQLLKKKNQTDKKEETPENPMEDSEYIFRQQLGKALVAFAKALNLREGQLLDVKKEDILNFTDGEVDKNEYDFMFVGPKDILLYVEEEMERVFADAKTWLSEMETDQKLASVFTRLRNNSPMLTVLRITGNHTIWQKVMREFVAEIAEGWPAPDTPAWDFLYENFYCQFALVLEKWETANFAKEKIPDCVSLLKTWLAVDDIIGRNHHDVLLAWN